MELLVAGSILAVTMTAIVSLFVFVFRVTQRSDDKSIAYNIARKEVEYIRSEGFSNALIVRNTDGTIASKFGDGTRVTYYSNTGAALASSQGATYSATLVVTSDRFDTVSGGGTRPAQDSIRTVIVTVRRISTNEVVHKDGTLLTRSGV
ncbi:MAG TPA: hypothetical protein VJ835_09600 [Fimbriimonadaceae bacterium]|nr:hypothetical protein [Fimbriimonadaceae bacterium]